MTSTPARSCASTRQADCVVGGRLELRLAEPALEVLVDRLEHPARARPAPDAHHGQRADGGRRGRRRQVRRDGDGDRLACHGSQRRRAHASRGLALGQRALADEKASLLAPPDERHELVAGHPAPGGKSSSTGNLGGAKLEELAALQRVHVLADQEKEPVAAVQISAVEARRRLRAGDGQRAPSPRSSSSRRGCLRTGTPRASRRRRCAAPATRLFSSSLRFLKHGEQT